MTLPDAPDDLRRGLLAAMAGLTAIGTSSASAAVRAMDPIETPALVAYFSRSGNTRVIAGLIQRSIGADLFEIVPANAYPEDYLATVQKATEERDRNLEPPLEAKVRDIGRYKTIFLGLPIWGETVPPVVRSFLAAHDLSGKTLVPFITHGGYGLGNSEAVLARHAPKAQLRTAFSMQADQERQTMNSVNAWLGHQPVYPR